MTQTWNALGQYTTSTYDALDRLTESTDYAGTRTSYTYDVLDVYKRQFMQYTYKFPLCITAEICGTYA